MNFAKLNARRALGGRMRWAILLALLCLCGCANPCERLCDAYFQMELRCDLLACDACASNDVCTGDEGAAADSNVLLQEAEYKIQQCKSDYRRLEDGADGELSEGEACQSYVPTLESLVEEYDRATDDCDRRVLCQQFEAIRVEMGR